MIMSSFTPLSFYPNSYPIFNPNEIRPRMVSVETISIVFTGLSISLAAFYYISNLRNAQKTQQLQLETRQAQLLMQIYSRLDTPEKSRAFTDIFTWDFTDFDDFLKKYDPLKRPEETDNLTSLVIYFEGIGTMLKEGFIDIHQVATLIGGAAVRFWRNFDHIKEDIRKHMNYPRWASETEYLYYELLKYKETHPDYKI
jgi:hypothetical protein